MSFFRERFLRPWLVDGYFWWFCLALALARVLLYVYFLGLPQNWWKPLFTGLRWARRRQQLWFSVLIYWDHTTDWENFVLEHLRMFWQYFPRLDAHTPAQVFRARGALYVIFCGQLFWDLWVGDGLFHFYGALPWLLVPLFFRFHWLVLSSYLRSRFLRVDSTLLSIPQGVCWRPPFVHRGYEALVHQVKCYSAYRQQGGSVDEILDGFSRWNIYWGLPFQLAYLLAWLGLFWDHTLGLGLLWEIIQG